MGATRWSEAHSARAHAILGETPRMTHPMTHTRARPHRSSVFVNVQREKDLARVRASLRTGPRATFQFRTESIRARLRKYGPPTAAQPPQPSRPTPAPPSPAQPNPTNLRHTRSRQAANLTTPWGGGGRGGHLDDVEGVAAARDLGGDEELLAWDAGLLDGLSNGRLVEVVPRAVQPIPAGGNPRRHPD